MENIFTIDDGDTSVGTANLLIRAVLRKSGFILRASREMPTYEFLIWAINSTHVCSIMTRKQKELTPMISWLKNRPGVFEYYMQEHPLRDIISVRYAMSLNLVAALIREVYTKCCTMREFDFPSTMIRHPEHWRERGYIGVAENRDREEECCRDLFLADMLVVGIDTSYDACDDNGVERAYLENAKRDDGNSHRSGSIQDRFNIIDSIPGVICIHD